MVLFFSESLGIDSPHNKIAVNKYFDSNFVDTRNAVLAAVCRQASEHWQAVLVPIRQQSLV